MAYLKQWAPRSYSDLELRVPRVDRGPGRHGAAALTRTSSRRRSTVDLVYLDPPYNQHSYFSNYHVWETLIRWDARRLRHRLQARRLPDDEERVQLEATCAGEALERCRHVAACDLDRRLVQQRGLPRPEPTSPDCWPSAGTSRPVELDFKRYVGAQIGIYNPSGAKVGSVGRLRNTEILFVVGPDPAVISAIQALPGGAAMTTGRPSPARF